MKKFIARLLSAVLLCGTAAGLTACGDTLCAHNYEEDAQRTVAATCHSDGTKYLVCTKCSNEKTEAITDRPAHNLGEGESVVWVKIDGTYHAKGCIVDGCDFVDSENKVAHVFVADETEIPNPATCHSDGIAYLKCSCGERKTEPITDRPAHTYGEGESTVWVSVDESNHAKRCLIGGCGHVDGEHAEAHNFVAGDDNNMVCDNCGYETEASEELIHIKGNTLKYSEGGTTHWYPCVNPAHTNCEAKFDEAVHDYTTELPEQGIPATCKENGKKVMKCDCGATEEVVIDKSTVSHSWDNGTVTKTATCQERGEKLYTCTVCGTTKTEETDKAEHNFTNSAWEKFDETYHARRCATEGCTELDKEAHNWVDNIEKEATFWEDGKKTGTCSVCAESKDETIVKSSTTYKEGFNLTLEDEKPVGDWCYGSVDYQWGDNEDFDFEQFTTITSEAWKFDNDDPEQHVQIKDGYIDANGKWAAVGFTFKTDMTAKIDFTFTGTTTTEGIKSKFNCRIGVKDKDGNIYGKPEFVGGEICSHNETIEFKAGDTIYFMIEHAGVGWTSGNLQITITKG